MMNQTAELRWFFRRPPPQPVRDWFEKVADPPQTRSDVYLVLRETDALGVKIRGGTKAFDLKLRPRPSQRLGLPGGITGELEEWQRWSLPRPAISRLFPRLGLPKAHWLEVRKERRLTTISYRGDADTGCRVELAALETQGRQWTTLGFESFGAELDLVPALEEAADAVFGSLDLPGNLDADLSCGYPGWLATL
jgi:hypothetical protein